MTPSDDLFAPHAALAHDLLPQACATGNDGAHDLAHILRVWRNVRSIHKTEGGDLKVLLAATLLHDCVAVEKDAPNRDQASRLAAAKARVLLTERSWDEDATEAVAHAVEAHSFSAAIPPRTLEARILQDADRLDAIGWIGIARCFSVSGRLGRALYDPADISAAQRPYDDSRFALDHFHTKLLTLADGFQTETGAAMAAERHKVMLQFVEGFTAEVGKG